MVVFVQKDNIKPKEKIVEKLGDFILLNKNFFDIFCETLVICNKADYYGKNMLDPLFLINPSIDRMSEEANTFVEMLASFFDTTDKILDKRRGDIVEYLLENIAPQSDIDGDFIKGTEFYIYYNGLKLGTSNHDIDLGIYSSSDNLIELYECKVRLKSFLYDKPPLNKEGRRKLGYLKRVHNDLVSIQSKDIFLVCLESNILCYRHTLDKYGYHMINIMNKDSIESLMHKSRQALA